MLPQLPVAISALPDARVQVADTKIQGPSSALVQFATAVFAQVETVATQLYPSLLIVHYLSYA